MKTTVKPTKKKAASGATILKSSIELNDISFETRTKDRSIPVIHPFSEGNDAKSKITPPLNEPYTTSVFKIKKLRLEMETTDMLTIEAYKALMEYLTNHR